MKRFDTYAANSKFDLVIAYVDNVPAGQAWGWPLDQRAREGWWAGLLTDLGSDFTREDGFRTFAFSEIMVCHEFAGKHLAHKLHNELLSKRNEERATLLVEPENNRAYRAYTHWGWRKVGQLRPGWPDAPLFDVLIFDLRHWRTA
jgi:hypothetical protein